jgi:hypothetical protein
MTGFEFRMGQNADIEGLDRSAQRVVELLLDDMKRGKKLLCGM